MNAEHILKHRFYELNPRWLVLFHPLPPLKFLIVKSRCSCMKWGAGIAQSVYRLATGWTVRGSNPGGSEIFHSRPDRPWGAHPASCTMGTGSLPEVRWPGRGVDHPPPFKRRGHERTGLYLYSPSGPLPFLPYMECVCTATWILVIFSLEVIYWVSGISRLAGSRWGGGGRHVSDESNIFPVHAMKAYRRVEV